MLRATRRMIVIGALGSLRGVHVCGEERAHACAYVPMYLCTSYLVPRTMYIVHGSNRRKSLSTARVGYLLLF